MASEVNLSFQDLNRFNFSWVLTDSPGEKCVIGFSSALQHWVAFPQLPAARAVTLRSPTASGGGFRAGTRPGRSTEQGVLGGTGVGGELGPKPRTSLTALLALALGKVSPETCSWLALKCPVLAE